MPILVGIVDAHPATLIGTAAILRPHDDLAVVAAGSRVADVLERVARLDLVMLDLTLSDGSTPAENVRALAPLGARVVAYASGGRRALLREAAHAGASGLIPKTDRVDAIVDAVRRAARGEAVTPPEWTAALAEDEGAVPARLSRRESEVLSLYAAGETAEGVARALFLSRETVLDHIRRIRGKYAAVDRAAPTKVDLFRRAVEDGLVSTDR